jgi:hypothetical protein
VEFFMTDWSFRCPRRRAPDERVAGHRIA